MITKTITKYFRQLADGREVELPFNPETDEITELHAGEEIILGCIVRDDSPSDPLEEFDDGTFAQFNHHYIHSSDRPDPEDFKEIIRANRRRVFYVRTAGDGYKISHQAFIKNADDIEEADGYYIAPADVTWPRKYAAGVMEQYSAWCTGDVWGVCIWTYDATTLELKGRDEVWGFYGQDYAEQELKSQLGAENVQAMA